MSGLEETWKYFGKETQTAVLEERSSEVKKKYCWEYRETFSKCKRTSLIANQ